MKRIWTTGLCLVAALVMSAMAAATGSAASSVLAWGWNASGQLGDGSTVRRVVPAHVAW